ncbi:carbohydrate porin [Synechococcus sp. NOUM97013]|uniref:carbohydrate porin n=1 Tax=Synechococcus sp. NOUM97013 TaxID=1442555 RepID=UPI001647E948|nr:carbohydrate porin [Synechococcus sp. NOUM97013]QNI74187.1 glutamate-1-semialdehyde aminotransferase domainprotein [Synechococcus sp. NOUM97013]
MPLHPFVSLEAVPKLFASALALASSAVFAPPARTGPIQSLLGLPEWADLSVTVTAQPMVGVVGGDQPGASNWYQAVSLGLSLSSGFGKDQDNWSELDHWQLNVEVTSDAGNPNLNTDLGSAFTLQTLVNPVGTWLTEASVVRNRGRGWWEAELGLMSLEPVMTGEPGFVAAPVMSSYFSSVFNNTMNLLVVGMPIDPFVAPGLKVKAHSESLGSLGYGYFYLNPQTTIASSLGANPGIPEVQGAMQALQWTRNPLPSRTDLSRPISLRDTQASVPRQLPLPELQLGGYLTSTRLLSDDADALGEGRNRGIYGSITWPLDLPVGLDSRLWAAGTVSLDPENNPYPTYVGGGWLTQGVVPSRPRDVVALGLQRTSFSSTLSPGKSYEATIELNYSIYVSDMLQIQPVMQWIINPGGLGNTPGIWAGGIQLNLNL